MKPLALLAACLLPALAFAGDLSPDTVAKVEHDKTKAMDEVAKKYGNKKSSELSTEERREMMKDQSAALNSVYDKNGVDPKEYSRYEARQNLGDRAATKDAAGKLEQKDADDKKKKEADANKPPKEIQVQRGFSNENPVTLEDKAAGGDGVVVEKGLPPDAMNDQSSANGAVQQGMSAPDKKGSGKGSRKR